MTSFTAECGLVFKCIRLGSGYSEVVWVERIVESSSKKQLGL